MGFLHFVQTGKIVEVVESLNVRSAPDFVSEFVNMLLRKITLNSVSPPYPYGSSSLGFEIEESLSFIGVGRGLFQLS